MSNPPSGLQLKPERQYKGIKIDSPKPSLFYRPYNPMIPRSALTVFHYVPFDVWVNIFEIYLLDAFPQRPILGDSLIEPLADYTPPHPSYRAPSCVPRNSCLTFRGARTGQTQKCGFKGDYDRRGLPALLHVNCHARHLLLSYPGYQAYYRFTDPALWCFKRVRTSTVLFSHRGLCLCALPRVMKLLPMASRAQLVLPSSNETHTRSPSRMIAETLRAHGAPRLVHFEAYSDWDGRHKEETRKLILVSRVIKIFKSVDQVFLVHGPSLETLYIGADEDFYTWRPSDLYSVLRACPLLRDVELISVLGPEPPEWDPEAELSIELSSLVRLRIRDRLPRLSALRRVLVTPSLARVEIDVISTHMGTATSNMDIWWAETARNAEFAAQSCPDSLLKADRLALRLHLQRDMDERFRGQYKPESWPEFMQFTMAARAEILIDPEAYPSEPLFTYTERSETTSTKAYSPAARATKVPSEPPTWILYTFWACTLNALNARYGAPKVSSRIVDIVASCDDLLPVANDWTNLLIALSGVRRLFVTGIRQYYHGLAHLAVCLGTRDKRDIPGESLEKIYLLDWDWSLDDIPVGELEDIMSEEREYLNVQATWH